MQFNDDSSGVPTFMIGITVLVMAGVGLSLVVDRRFKFSSNQNVIQKDLRENNEIIATLKSQCDERSAALGNYAKYKQQAAMLKQLAGEAENLEIEQAQLRIKQRTLSTALNHLESESTQYRSECRQQIWTRAVREELGHLKLRDGREYEDVTITRVTENGLEFRHEFGIASVDSTNLDQKLRERFQWTEEKPSQPLPPESAPLN